MKKLSWIVAAALVAGATVTPAFAEKAKEKAKPYPLETCLVSDEKLGEDPDMKPFAFVHAVFLSSRLPRPRSANRMPQSPYPLPT